MIPCKECLKYSICINKNPIKCIDLVQWLLIGDDKYEVGERISSFESWCNRDLDVIGTKSNKLLFKEIKNNYQCIIITNY